MRKYKIREEKFEDGRSEFIPQFEEGGQFHDFFDLSGFKKDRLPMISRRFKTFDEAKSEIDNDKLKSMKPIEVKIHDVD